MEQIIQWLMSLDTTAISAAIVGLITTWGGTIIWLAISSIKNKLKKTQFEEELANSKIENAQELARLLDEFKISVIDRLTDIQQEIIAKDEASQTARLEAIKALANDVQTATVELTQVSETPADINTMLDDLE
jgi:hypothetical protein